MSRVSNTPLEAAPREAAREAPLEAPKFAYDESLVDKKVYSYLQQMLPPVSFALRDRSRSRELSPPTRDAREDSRLLDLTSEQTRMSTDLQHIKQMITELSQ